MSAQKPAGAKAKKVFSMTDKGREVLVRQTLLSLRDIRPTYSSVLLGMAHWPVLEREAALKALEVRRDSLEAELKRIENVQFTQQPLPDFVEALFDFSLSQLKAEAEWTARTLDYMRSKPWLE